MKKLLAIIVLSSLWCNVGFAICIVFLSGSTACCSDCVRVSYVCPDCCCCAVLICVSLCVLWFAV